jgi:hypothetical protein
VDEFAGILRAVLFGHAPSAPLIDITHGIPPCAVRAGALTLRRSVGFLGAGVVLAVVDPEVGGKRRAVAVETAAHHGPRYLVGPDNGLLAWAVEELGGVRRVAELTGPPDASRTFDGRDLFAPVAARLWSGAPLDTVGGLVAPASLVRLSAPLVETLPGAVRSEVLWVDRFGNVQLAARRDTVRDAGIVLPDAPSRGVAPGSRLDVSVDEGASDPRHGTRAWPIEGRLVSAFVELEDDALGVLGDANGHVAVVRNRGSAAETLGVTAGDVVTLRVVESS